MDIYIYIYIYIYTLIFYVTPKSRLIRFSFCFSCIGLTLSKSKCSNETFVGVNSIGCSFPDILGNKLSSCVAFWISFSVQVFWILFVTFLSTARFEFFGPILFYGLKWNKYRNKYHTNFPYSHIAVGRCSAKW